MTSKYDINSLYGIPKDEDQDEGIHFVAGLLNALGLVATLALFAGFMYTVVPWFVTRALTTPTGGY